jgi:hypothetical protein
MPSNEKNFKDTVKRLAVLLRPYPYKSINELVGFTWVPVKDERCDLKAISPFLYISKKILLM